MVDGTYHHLKEWLVNPLAAIVAFDFAKWEFWCFFAVKIINIFCTVGAHSHCDHTGTV